LEKVPSSREDVFTSSLSLQEKRKLMKFLNFATSTESFGTSTSSVTNKDIPGTLDDLLSSSEYNLPLALRNIIQYAIALAPAPGITTGAAIQNLQRHLKSHGVYGAFSIVVPLHGGGGELSQAFCRAAAVKGATYILGRSIHRIDLNTDEYPIKVVFDVKDEDLATVQCRNVIKLECPTIDCVEITRSISVVQGLEGLFGENRGDAALIVVAPGTLRAEQSMPIQIIIHGGGIGECPLGQCNSLAHGDANGRGDV
jgi:RAB protein geranylgeranyltransferase component A